MSEEAKPAASTLTAGDARLVMALKVVEYTGLALFLIIIPREMGPERYGSLALLNTLLGLFLLVGALGGPAIFGRFIPEFRSQDDEVQVRRLFTQFLLLRCIYAALGAAVFYGLLQRFLPDMAPGTRWAATALAALSAISVTSFQLQFGLNRLVLWMSRESSNRLLLVFFLFAIGGTFDLEHIVLVMLAIESVFLVLGFYWSRGYFLLDRESLRLSGVYRYLKFGMLFFASNLLLMLIWRSGELLIVELSGQGMEAVAYYNIASAIAITLYALFGQLGVLVVPSLSAMHVSGEHEKKIRWMGNVLKYTTLGAWMGVITVKTMAGPAIKLLMGEAYLPVAENLFILVLALVPMNIIRIALSSALVHERLRANLWVTASALTGFLVSAFLLTPDYGPEGTSTAVVIGASCGAVVAYRVFLLGEIFRVARYWVLTGICALSMILMYSRLLPEIAAGVLALLALLTAAFVFRILHMDEIRWITGVSRKV